MTHSTLLFDVESEKWPIVYRPEYNVHFMGLEKFHPFDARKWGNIYNYLKRSGLINENTITVPNEALKEDLLVVHTEKYLKSLKCSLNVAMIAEVLPLCVVPNCLVQKGYLRPMRYQVGGTILCGKLALERGWAINLGGGFHHCSANRGGGFCPYADITLLAKFAFHCYPKTVQRLMIVDLDAHQGNGYARDFQHDDAVYIFDVYNAAIYPFDQMAKTYINRRVELHHHVQDEEYLGLIESNLSAALIEFKPQLIVYNAGTDILRGDTLGGLDVTAQGVVKRDEIVFRLAKSSGAPIVMLTSGGYLKKTARIIATSIVNLVNAGLVDRPTMKY